MAITFSPLSNDDATPLLDIFNYYVEKSMAAYPETPLSPDHFSMLLKSVQGYPSFTIKDGTKCLGFGLLKPFHQLSTFSRTAEISEFIHPDYTQQGIGRQLLQLLIEGARKKNLVSIIASISSLNPASIAFHKKYGFQECGCFRRVGKKKSQEFDIQYFQLMC